MKHSTIFYEKPATQWTEALPLGNGKLGAMVYGNPSCDRYCLNDELLWSGSPLAENNPGAKDVLADVRDAIKRKDFVAADRLAHGLQGPNSDAYLPLADLLIKTNFTGRSSRELDLRTGVHTVQSEGIRQRSFVSNGLVIEYEFQSPMDLTVGLAPAHPVTETTVTDRRIQLSGRAPETALPTEDAGAEFYAATDAEALGSFYEVALELEADVEPLEITWLPKEAPPLDYYGQGEQEDRVHQHELRALSLTGAKSVRIKLVSAVRSPIHILRNDPEPGQTLYVPDEVTAHTTRLTVRSEVLESLADVSLKPCEIHREMYDRVELDLVSEREQEVPKDLRERILCHDDGDHALAALFFHYARYLLIAGSREDSELPLTLTGIWSPLRKPDWRSNYTININTQMNYWPAEPLNLGETAEPLYRLLERMQRRGEETAKINYGLPGWVAHHNTDAWAKTAPVGDWGKESPSWSLWPMGGAWLALQWLERLRYRTDEFALERAKPVLKGLCDFLAAWVQEDGSTIPATSPENEFVVDDEFVSVSYNAAMDHSLILELLTAYQAYYGAVADYEEALHRLFELQIGADGRLLEWGEEHVEKDMHHRHVSHLLAVYPGRSVTEETPELFEAFRRSLEVRGDEATGWGMAWRIALWARFADGDRAYSILRTLLRPAFDESGKGLRRLGSVYANLFDAHPPFQIDGNFGAAAGIAEFFVQNEGEELQTLHLGKAMPSSWTGKVRGLRAAHGTEVDLDFERGNITYVGLKTSVPLTVKINKETVITDLAPGRINLEQTPSGAYTLL